jgi:hypothetical protein
MNVVYLRIRYPLDEHDQVVDLLSGVLPHRLHRVAERPQDLLGHVEELGLPGVDHDPQVRLLLQFELPARRFGHHDRLAPAGRVDHRDDVFDELRRDVRECCAVALPERDAVLVQCGHWTPPFRQPSPLLVDGFRYNILKLKKRNNKQGFQCGRIDI